MDDDEVYGLSWPGKRAAAREAARPATASLELDPEASVSPATTGNLVIEGDNLEALKLLREEYAGRIGTIYIDPPYNTGNDFVYNDSFRGEGDLGGRVHGAWLSMMYARLSVARDLLAADGVGFVSIDANEVAQLTLLLSELFGEGNVFSTIVWVSNLKGRQIRGGGPAGTHEYVLCFSRDATAVRRFVGSADELRRLMPAVYKGAPYPVKHDERGPYVTKNRLHNTNSRFNEKTLPTMVYRIHYHPETGEVRVSDIDDDTTFPGFLTVMPHPNARPGVRWHAWRWSRAKVLAEHADLEFEVTGDQVRIHTKVRDVDAMTMKDLVIGPSTTTGQAELRALGLARVFETPKPVELIRLLVAVASDPDGIVLDFFAGSGTTAEAVMRQNARDGGSRRWIMVQLDEPCAPGTPAAEAGFATVSAITRERIRRAGERIDAPGVDTGFRALRLVEKSV